MEAFEAYLFAAADTDILAYSCYYAWVDTHPTSIFIS